MIERTQKASAKDAGRDLVVALCGLATSVATAIILKVAEHVTGVALYTWMVWAVIPVGAIFSGMAGATGYLLGARLIGRAPSPVMLFNILLASVATFLLIHYLDYIVLTVAGQRVADHLSFPTYLDMAIRSLSLNVGVGSMTVSSGSIGIAGYLPATLQVLGFAVGGLMAYTYLVRQPFCNRCSRYLTMKGISNRYTADTRAVEQSAPAVAEYVRNGSFGAALAAQRALGVDDEGNGGNYRTRIEVRACPRCGTHWSQYSVAKLGDDGWTEMNDPTVANFSDEPVNL